jgi:hypothetical protein
MRKELPWPLTEGVLLALLLRLPSQLTVAVKRKLSQLSIRSMSPLMIPGPHQHGSDPAVARPAPPRRGVFCQTCRPVRWGNQPGSPVTS